LQVCHAKIAIFLCLKNLPDSARNQSAIGIAGCQPEQAYPYGGSTVTIPSGEPVAMSYVPRRADPPPIREQVKPKEVAQ
jgi:hypothetical protein